MKLYPSVGLGMATFALALAAVDARADFELESTRIPAGGNAVAQYIWNGGDAVLKVFASNEVEVPLKIGDAAVSETKVLEKKIAGHSTNEVSFAADRMVAGRIRFRAEVADKTGAVLARENSPWIAVSVRDYAIDLSGDWQVAGVEPFPVNRDGSEPKIDPASIPPALSLPGTIAAPGWPRGFRGWVTLKKTVDIPVQGIVPLRFVAKGVADSVALRVNGEDIAEMTPEADLDSSLSHWSYFHGERLYKGVKGREDSKRLCQLLWDRDVDRDGFQATIPPTVVAGGSAELELVLRATSGTSAPQPPYGIHGEISLSPISAVYVDGADFDTAKQGDMRRFTFSVRIGNTTQKTFKGRIRAVYGQYSGRLPYTGACPAVADSFQDVEVPPGGCTVEVVRDETPRFATCRATFLLQKGSDVLDAESLDYHAVCVEIRDRRDLYVNNERFFAKGRGSRSNTPNEVWQFQANGTNMRRGMDSIDWPQYPGLRSRAAFVDSLLPEGILFDTGPILASCEKCTFWNPDDTSNVERAVRSQIKALKDCPGIIQWEATNELFGEPEEARVLICDLFRKLDPYHRPVVMTKGGGEWEAIAEDGAVAGPDIVGVQYLGTKEAIDALTATITEQPIESTEINWNDSTLVNSGLWRYGLDHGVCGMLLFDYSGKSTDQAVTAVPPGKMLPGDSGVEARIHREMYLDIECTARHAADGGIVASFANRMPFTLRDVELAVRDGGRVSIPALAPGEACEIAVPATAAQKVGGERNPWIVARASYTTHGGLKNDCALCAEVVR